MRYGILVNLFFWLNLALLLVHELDAVRRQEWRMFAGLNRLADEPAHQMFALLHAPLFVALFWLVSRPNPAVQFWFQLGVDAFLVIHLGLHLLFQRHPANAFTAAFSRYLIGGMGLLGLAHAVVLLAGQSI